MVHCPDSADSLTGDGGLALYRWEGWQVERWDAEPGGEDGGLDCFGFTLAGGSRVAECSVLDVCVSGGSELTVSSHGVALLALFLQQRPLPAPGQILKGRRK